MSIYDSKKRLSAKLHQQHIEASVGVSNDQKGNMFIAVYLASALDIANASIPDYWEDFKVEVRFRSIAKPYGAKQAASF